MPRRPAIKEKKMYRAYEGPNGGWYVAWENAEGFHHQPDSGGELSETAAKRIARRKNDDLR